MPTLSIGDTHSAAYLLSPVAPGFGPRSSPQYCEAIPRRLPVKTAGRDRESARSPALA